MTGERILEFCKFCQRVGDIPSGVLTAYYSGASLTLNRFFMYGTGTSRE